MTDTEQKRIQAICKVDHIENISDLSDGYHTFKQLYYQRMMLFAALVKQNKDRAWKSLRHSDGELCFGGGWFIVGIDTPQGSYTYHYEDNFYSLFDCVELEYGKVWDGHTEEDVTRLLSLEQEPCEDCISRREAIKMFTYTPKGEHIPDYDCDNFPVQVDVKVVKEILRELPSVNLQPKTGHWIDADGDNAICGCCNRLNHLYGTYCKHCGAKMNNKVKEWK